MAALEMSSVVTLTSDGDPPAAVLQLETASISGDNDNKVTS